MIVVFVGHSQLVEKKRIEERVAIILETLICDCPCFYLGAYGDFDRLALNACLRYKSGHQGSKLVFVTPYLDEVYLKNREETVHSVDEVLYPAIESTPKKYAIIKRNHWMVDQADLIIAYVKYSWGGAAKTLEYARKKGKKIYNIAE